MADGIAKGRDVQPGQVIKSAGRWYTVKEFTAPGSDWIRHADCTDSKGAFAQILVFSDDDYPVKAPRP